MAWFPPPACNPEVGPLLLSTLVLVCCTALPISNSQAADDSPAPRVVESRSSGEPSEPAITTNAKVTKPDAPLPTLTAANLDPVSSAEPETPARPPIHAAVKPATAESYVTSRQRKIWYGLMAASHGAAAFDAWTTRRAITGGYGTEGDPLQRPFANSGAIYATTQIVPALMDYMGHRMMRSENPVIRKFWWVPQAASTGVSLGAGIHNDRVVH